MRKVKYKAFDKVNGEWLDSDDLIFQGGCWFKNFRALEDYVALPVDEGDVAIVQFSSLKDRNGKEIYEGDIVERYGGFRYEVVLAEGAFYLGEYRTPDFLLSDDLVEVIGNIYEHPHLLEGVK